MLAAKRRVIQAEAQSIVAALGALPELEDPEAALMQTVTEYIAIKDVLRAKASTGLVSPNSLGNCPMTSCSMLSR